MFDAYSTQGGSMKRTLIVTGLIAMLVFAIAGCELFGISDRIVGNWQLVSINGTPEIVVTVAVFTDSTYEVTSGGIPTYEGTWTKSGGTYTLTGTFFWFASSGSFTPTFSNSSNTLTYSNGSGDIYIWNRQ